MWKLKLFTYHWICWLLSRKILLSLSHFRLAFIVVNAYAEIDLHFYSLEDLRRIKAMRWKGTDYAWLLIFASKYAFPSSRKKKGWERARPLLAHTSLLHELGKRHLFWEDVALGWCMEQFTSLSRALTHGQPAQLCPGIQGKRFENRAVAGIIWSRADTDIERINDTGEVSWEIQ